MAVLVEESAVVGRADRNGLAGSDVVSYLVGAQALELSITTESPCPNSKSIT